MGVITAFLAGLVLGGVITSGCPGGGSCHQRADRPGRDRGHPRFVAETRGCRPLRPGGALTPRGRDRAGVRVHRPRPAAGATPGLAGSARPGPATLFVSPRPGPAADHPDAPVHRCRRTPIPAGAGWSPYLLQELGGKEHPRTCPREQQPGNERPARRHRNRRHRVIAGARSRDHEQGSRTRRANAPGQWSPQPLPRPGEPVHQRVTPWRSDARQVRSGPQPRVSRRTA